VPTYSHFYRVAQDLQGNAVMGVMGTITLAGTSTPATLYADPDGVTPLPNPLANDAQYGSFSVYLGSGHYDMTFAKEGYVFEPLEDILIPDASGGVIALVGTPNQVIVSSTFGNVVLSTPQNTDPDATIQFAHLGLGTPGIASHGLVVETYSDFRNTIAARHITSSADVTARRFLVNDYAGNDAWGLYSTLNAAGGTNRWAIWAGGNAPSHLGGSLAVIGAVSFNSTFNVASNVGIGGSLTVTGTGAFGGALTTGGTFYAAGVVGLGGYAPLPGQYHLHTGSILAASLLTSGTVAAAGAVSGDEGFFHGGRLICYRLGISDGDPGSTYALYSAGGLHHFGGIVQIGTTVSSHWLNAAQIYSGGQIYGAADVNCNQLVVRAAGSTMGVANQGYWLNVGNLYSASIIYSAANVDCNLLNVRAGNSFFNGGVGIGWGNEAGFWLTVPNIKTGAVTWTDTSTGGFLNLGGDLNVANVLAGVNGYKPGGGDWVASSSRTLKRNIAPIPNALELLLEQRGRVYEWDEPMHARLLPGPRYGFVFDEVTIPQWRTTTPEGEEALAIQGFQALTVEALRQLVVRLEALGG
jgi:hypothetical protein